MRHDRLDRRDLQQPGHDTSVPRIALAIPGSERRPERPEVLNQADSSSSDVDSCESDDSDDSDLDIDALLEDISENHSPPNVRLNDLRHVAEGQASGAPSGNGINAVSQDEVYGVHDSGSGTALLAELPKLSLATGHVAEGAPEAIQEVKSTTSMIPDRFQSEPVVDSEKPLPSKSERIIVHQPQPPTPTSTQYSRPPKPTPNLHHPPEHPEQTKTETVHQGTPGQALEPRPARPARPARPERPQPDDMSIGDLAARRAEAERLWKEQVRLEIWCDILRSLSCVKADEKVFKAVTAELKQRVRLQEEARERLEVIRSNLTGADGASQQRLPSKSSTGITGITGLTYSIERTKADMEHVTALEHPVIHLEREARRLHGQLLSKIRVRAEAEAKKAFAEAEKKKKDAEQWRRSAKASLEIRKKLQPCGSERDPKSGPRAHQTFDPGVRRKQCLGTCVAVHI